MSKEDWRWLPHAGHFIGATECRFRMATVVGNGRWLVSTVGEYYPRFPTDRKDQTEIGWGRLYETMVFPCHEDAQAACCGYSASDFSERAMMGYNDAQAARLGHFAMCQEWDAVADRQEVPE